MRRIVHGLSWCVAGLLMSAQVSPEVRLDATPEVGPGWHFHEHVAVAALGGGQGLVAFVEYGASARASGLWVAHLQGNTVTRLVQPAPTVLAQRHPALSCGPSRCLLAWLEETPNRTTRIMALALSHAGLVLAGPALVEGTPTSRSPPALATIDGTQWFLVWSDQDVFAIAVDEQARPVGAPIAVAAQAEAETEASVAVLGSGYVVAWSTPLGLRARTLSTTGLPGPVWSVGPPGALVSMASSGSMACVSWEGPPATTLYAARLSPTGVVDAPPLIVDSVVAGVETRPFVAFDGTHFLLHRVEAYDRVVRHALAPLDGGLSGPQVLPSMRSIYQGAVSYSAGEGLMAFDGTTLRTWWSTTFTTLPPVVRPRIPPASQRALSAAFFDGGFFVAFEASVADQRRTSVLRVDVDGQPVGSTRVFEPGTTESPDPALVSDGVSALMVHGRFSPTRGLVARSVNADGTPGAVATAFPGNGFGGQALVSDGAGGFIAVWRDEGLIRAARPGLASPRDVFVEPQGLFHGLSVAFSLDAGVGLVAWDVNSSGPIRVGLVGSDLRPLTDGGLRPFTPGPPQVSPTVASNGRDFLLAWVDDGASSARVRFVLMTPAGLIRSGPTVVSSSVPFQGSPGAPFAVWDATSWVLGYERFAPATGTDLFFVRVFDDGGVGPERTLTAAPESEEGLALAASTPGRVLAVYSRFTADAGAQQVFARLVTEVPSGAPCRADRECVDGACVVGRCGRADVDAGEADAGPADAGPLVDAGTALDGGPAVDEALDGGALAMDAGIDSAPRRLFVGCGCGSGDGLAGLLVTLTLALVARRAGRPFLARPSRTPGR